MDYVFIHKRKKRRTSILIFVCRKLWIVSFYMRQFFTTSEYSQLHSKASQVEPNLGKLFAYARKVITFTLYQNISTHTINPFKKLHILFRKTFLWIHIRQKCTRKKVCQPANIAPRDVLEFRIFNKKYSKYYILFLVHVPQFEFLWLQNFLVGTKLEAGSYNKNPIF